MDGKEFNTPAECEKYEEEISKFGKYWVVYHNADTTETGLCQNRTYIKTIWEGFPAQQGENETQILEDFCYDKFGKRTAWVQGVAPCENWILHQINQHEFENPVPVRWGGYDTKTEMLILGVGNRGKINTIKRWIYNE